MDIDELEGEISSRTDTNRRLSVSSAITSFWRWVFPLIVVAFVIWSVVLFIDGLQTVLDSEEGKIREAVTDPTAPGFEAFVEQTWSMLVVTEDSRGELAQAAVVAIADRENGGGTVLLIPPELNASGCNKLPCNFIKLYSESGLDRIRKSVSELIGVGVSEVALLTPARWEVLVNPVSPISVELEEELLYLSQSGDPLVRFPAGLTKISAENFVDFMAIDDGAELGQQLERQAGLWREWMASVGSGSGAAANLPNIDLPIVKISEALSKGPVLVVDTVWERNERGASFSQERLDTLVLNMFPFPIFLPEQERPTVRLLNGSGDFSLDAPARELVRKTGAEITVIGNFRNDHVIQTRVVYRDPKMSDQANALAAALGAGVIYDETVSPVTDLTILIGKDFRFIGN